jgi:uncharacterized protein YdaU (DUF1376 family)
MGAEPFGGYCSLLLEAWLDPDGSLANDPEELALLSRLGKKGWAQHGAKLMTLFEVVDDRLRSEIIEEAREKANRRRESAKVAVTARIEKARYVEPEPASTDDRPMIDRSSKEKEKEKEKVKEKEPNPVGFDKPTVTREIDFEAFWIGWKSLGSKTTLNKKATLESWRKAIRRGATPDDLLQAIKVYDRYLKHREKNGKPDSRDFIPMPETWLNQDRWSSEYPEDVLDGMVGDPISGRDFYWKSFKDAKGYEVMGKFWIDPETGEKTDRSFNDAKWRQIARSKAL